MREGKSSFTLCIAVFQSKWLTNRAQFGHKMQAAEFDDDKKEPDPVANMLSSSSTERSFTPFLPFFRPWHGIAYWRIGDEMAQKCNGSGR